MALGILSKKVKELNQVVLLPLEQIKSNPSQPRKYFDENSIRELAESIRENGLLQPVTVRRAKIGYELIAGERRMLAFRLLKREIIPAIVESYTDEQSATLALIENIQRENLNCFEQAFAISEIMREQGLTQQQMSMRLGMAQSTIANKLRLLQYPSQVREAFLRYRLTERHARALLRVQESSLQLEIIRYTAENHLTVEQTERYIDTRLLPQRQASKPRRMILKDMRIFVNTIKKAVDTMTNAGIPVRSDTTETDEYYEYTIRVPKAEITRSKEKE